MVEAPFYFVGGCGPGDEALIREGIKRIIRALSSPGFFGNDSRAEGRPNDVARRAHNRGTAPPGATGQIEKYVGRSGSVEFTETRDPRSDGCRMTDLNQILRFLPGEAD